METAFGDRVHQLIALKLMGFDSSRIGRLVGDSDEAHWRKAESILATPRLRELLDGGGEILIEQEFVSDRQIVRPDLLVMGREDIWIVDYKTGVNFRREQLEHYRRVIQILHPQHQVHAAVISAKGWIDL